MYLFRDEYLNIPGLEVTERELKALREATTIMALNRVELDGRLSNVGPCWFFPVATSVVFGFTQDEGKKVDELYHGAGSPRAGGANPSSRTPRPAAVWCTGARQPPTWPAAA
ncbi:hypothetical protein FHS40_008763 [Streptomyces spectabilis]|uniref:Uncharacterized protein n=1 Tax=Streptomyces spectabilis TaxID=68270 RepID=A0A7W8EZP2_STRST|nr:hypothetical protein [Streptomyces spectabilis]